MIEVAIPGDGRLGLSFLVLDYNGTMACNGTLLDGVAERLIALSKTYRSTLSQPIPSAPSRLL